MACITGREVDYFPSEMSWSTHCRKRGDRRQKKKGGSRNMSVTTEQAKFEEEQLLDLVRGGWNTGEPIGREFAFEPGKLTDEQRKAFAHILASRDLVMDVSGIA
jgi:hypothetical protein